MFGRNKPTQPRPIDQFAREFESLARHYARTSGADYRTIFARVRSVMLSQGWLKRDELIDDLAKYLEETQPTEGSMLGAFAAKMRDTEAKVPVAVARPRSIR
jgi:hypothetical protein